MKILNLILKNINSLKGENSIDFKTNFDNSLFLITGDTGAGKSTILDAICCALYNETPRLKDTKQLMSKHTGEANITLEYEINGELYRNSWSVQRAYKKTDTKFQDVIMSIAKFDTDANEFVSIESKINKVKEKVQEVTGLDFTQFQKSILLSQGNFDAFLKAKANQRADLLEKMTGTSIYAKIGAKVFEEYKLKKRVIEDISLKQGDIRIFDDEILKENEENLINLKKIIANLSKSQKENESIIQEINKKETLQNDIEKFSKNVDNYKIEFTRLQKDEKVLIKEFELKKKENNCFTKEYLKEIEIIEIVEKLDMKIDLYFENEKKTTSNIKNLDIKKEKVLLLINRETLYIQKLQEDNHNAIEYLTKNKDDSLLLKEFDSIKLKIEQYLKLKQKLKTELKIKVSLEKNLEDSQEEIKRDKNSLLSLVDKLEYIKSKTIVLKYEEARRDLEDEEACPLCGSLEHPYKNLDGFNDKANELLNEQSQLLIAIKEYENRIESLQMKDIKNQTKLESSIEILKSVDSDLEQTILEFDRYCKYYNFTLEDDLENIKDKLQKRFDIYSNYKTKNDNYEKELSTKETNLKVLESQKINNLEQIQKERVELESLKKDSMKLSKNRMELYDNKNTVTKKRELLENKKILDEIITTSLKKQQENSSELKSLESKILEYEKLIIEKEILYNSLNTKYSLEDKEKLNSESNEIKKNLESSNQEYGQLKQKLEDNDKKIKSSKKYLDEIKLKEKEIKPYAILNNLIGDSTGKVFKKFAQNLTLAYLLELANKHLKTLNERYMLIKDEHNDLEILVVDTYQAHIERSVNSLSGGEGFLVSLALALGLSDMVSSKVSIDSLFLDEGFGTLDSKTLNDALTTLLKLQDSGKMIGIISHVELLKNEIDLQIEVKKSSNGIGSIQIKKS